MISALGKDVSSNSMNVNIVSANSIKLYELTVVDVEICGSEMQKALVRSRRFRVWFAGRDRRRGGRVRGRRAVEDQIHETRVAMVNGGKRMA